MPDHYVAVSGQPKKKPKGYDEAVKRYHRGIERRDAADLDPENLWVANMPGCCGISILRDFPFTEATEDRIAYIVAKAVLRMNAERTPYVLATINERQYREGWGKVLQEYLGFEYLEMPITGLHGDAIYLYGLSFKPLGKELPTYV